jgi:hypothetical protein
MVRYQMLTMKNFRNIYSFWCLKRFCVNFKDKCLTVQDKLISKLTMSKFRNYRGKGRQRDMVRKTDPGAVS